MLGKLRNQFFVIWYWYINSIDKEADVVFMNYGFSNNNHRLTLKEEDEKNRFSIQLYHHTVSHVDLREKNVLEVGSGRGGGLSYINRYLSPKSSIGVDLSRKAVEFCRRYYRKDKISFIHGDAHRLPFEDNSFDVLINVESSHRYPRVEMFFSEAHRVLKPGGYLLFADFRNHNKVDELESLIDNCKLHIEYKEDITGNVLEALTLSNNDREELIKKLAPKPLHGLSKNFAAMVGTPSYNKFSARKFLYLRYALRK